MIDVHQPIELDDGRPARIVDVRGDLLRVKIAGPWRRLDNDERDEHVWGYNRLTGLWNGADEIEAFTIRNVIDEPVVEEDWS